MATHSSILAWIIPGTEEPSGLLSMGSHRVGHDGSDLAAAAAAVSCVKKKKKHYFCQLHFIGWNNQSLPSVLEGVEVSIESTSW